MFQLHLQKHIHHNLKNNWIHVPALKSFQQLVHLELNNFITGQHFMVWRLYTTSDHEHHAAVFTKDIMGFSYIHTSNCLLMSRRTLRLNSENQALTKYFLIDGFYSIFLFWSTHCLTSHNSLKLWMQLDTCSHKKYMNHSPLLTAVLQLLPNWDKQVHIFGSCSRHAASTVDFNQF
jgi:hypothetical protein